MINRVLSIKYTTYDLISKILIIFESQNDYLYIDEIHDKILDIHKMPDYIMNDYYKYRSNVLSLDTLNRLLTKIRTEYSLNPHLLGNKLNVSSNKISEEEEEIIKKLRRDLKIKEII